MQGSNGVQERDITQRFWMTRALFTSTLCLLSKKACHGLRDWELLPTANSASTSKPGTFTERKEKKNKREGKRLTLGEKGIWEQF